MSDGNARKIEGYHESITSRWRTASHVYEREARHRLNTRVLVGYAANRPKQFSANRCWGSHHLQSVGYHKESWINPSAEGKVVQDSRVDMEVPDKERGPNRGDFREEFAVTWVQLKRLNSEQGT